MGNRIVVNEEYISIYYAKRNELNKLQEEVKEMSDTIKNYLYKNNTPFGKTFGKYITSVNVKYRLNKKFIQWLKNNDMNDRIEEICEVKNAIDLIANFTDAERHKYLDEWYKQLIVRKK